MMWFFQPFAFMSRHIDKGSKKIKVSHNNIFTILGSFGGGKCSLGQDFKL